MNKYKIYYSALALSDIKGIYEYICFSLSSPINARNLIFKIRNDISNLETFPNASPLVDLDQWCKTGLRKLTVDNYIIFYFVDENEHTVNISRVFYGGRNIDSIAKELSDQ